MPQPRTILLVDDEERLLSAMKRRLSGEFDVITATSGPLALKLIDETPSIAVIIADMQMPEMSGIELLKAVREKAPSIRRLMLTGNADQETAVAAINEGKVMRFLRKPSDAEEVKAAIRLALADFEFQSPETAIRDARADRGEIARDAFLAMMNHELRTPLNHVIGLAAVLEATPPRSDDPQSLDLLRKIQASGQQMLTLVSRILDFVHLSSSSSGEVAAGVFDIVALINREVEGVRPPAKAKEVTISVDSLRRRSEVRGDETHICLAVRELLSNAVKFNPKGGHVSILVKSDADEVAVKITDTGCGIPEDKLVEIVKPFRQADESYARRHDGAGLGLALVSTIAALNHFSFTIASPPGGGAVATMVFPRAAAQGAKSAA